ncbi:nitroreductase/quinone reductase family protein [Streptomyces sp. NPDC059875]|uniref:nitroreductase/quinone reductase family protein n=1 Tax=unclassified Streptomyces TaxID=2593676 RepID=UPI003653CF6F
MSDFNQQVIEEFRANGGKVGGMFEGASLLLLTTTGARSGRPHTNPAVYVRDGARLLIFASNAGGPKHPAWFHNLRADAHVTVERGTPDGTVERFSATAEVVEGAERDRLFGEQCDRDPAFAAYQAGTERVIPVVALHRIDLTDPARHRAMADQLVRVHDELRTELTAVREGLTSVPALGSRLARHCLTFCSALHAHHHNEDSVFDQLAGQFPNLGPALDRIRRDHQVVARTVEELEDLVRGGGAAGTLRADVDRLAAHLEEHFAYEEAHLLPALRGTVDAVGREG